MSKIEWRAPQPGEKPPAVFHDGLNVLDAAEVLDAPEARQARRRMYDSAMVVVALSGPSLVSVLVRRHEDSFVWIIWHVRLSDAEEVRYYNEKVA